MGRIAKLLVLVARPAGLRHRLWRRRVAREFRIPPRASVRAAWYGRQVAIARQQAEEVVADRARVGMHVRQKLDGRLVGGFLRVFAADPVERSIFSLGGAIEPQLRGPLQSHRDD